MSEQIAAAHLLLPETLQLDDLLQLPTDFFQRSENKNENDGQETSEVENDATHDKASHSGSSHDRLSANDAPISKAAFRMRQYRAEHKNDIVWLNKEAERMRRMRAKRKGLPDSESSLAISFDEFGNLVGKAEKVRRNPRARSKVGDVKLEAPIENSEFTEASTEADITAAAASLRDRNSKREEFRKKEAERIRRYRALKRQDQVWKDKDAERMRLYRAKRKTSTVKSDFKNRIPIPHEPSHYDIQLSLDPLPYALDGTSVPQMPNHAVQSITSNDKKDGEATNADANSDSENEMETV